MITIGNQRVWCILLILRADGSETTLRSVNHFATPFFAALLNLRHSIGTSRVAVISPMTTARVSKTKNTIRGDNGYNRQSFSLLLRFEADVWQRIAIGR